MTERVCENCAMADDELVLVRRVYITAETQATPDAIVSRQVIDEPELWCVSCVTQYPCELVD